MRNLITCWRKDADQYQRQVEEARSKGLPCDQMLSMATCLKACAKELEQTMKNNEPNDIDKGIHNEWCDKYKGGECTCNTLPPTGIPRITTNPTEAEKSEALAISSKPEQMKPSCDWTYCDDKGGWDTSCGEAFIFMESGPRENGFLFCPYCGKPTSCTKE